MIRPLSFLTTFLSAALLFIVQPLFAKYLLPFFGGAASVWTISVFFYSVLLLAGYIYASILMSWERPKALIVHTSLLVVAGGLLLWRYMTQGSPFLIEVVISNSPAFSVLLTLLAGVAVPVLLLASTTVIVQTLYAEFTREEPYQLFSCSNAGSLLGLASYPFIIEPFLSLSTQVVCWTIGFLIFSCSLVLMWYKILSNIPSSNTSKAAEETVFQSWFLLVVLAAIPTFLLASVTEFLSKGIASFPFMWVTPLMLYLISFIVAFRPHSKQDHSMSLEFWTLLSIGPALILLPTVGLDAIFYWLAFFYTMLAFFLTSVFLHRRIYKLRPKVTGLGVFYILLSAGGAIGSGIVGLLLPIILNDTPELFLTLILLTLYFLIWHCEWLIVYVPKFILRTIQGALIIVALIGTYNLFATNDSLVAERNFYGTLKVLTQTMQAGNESVEVRSVVNGATIHGLQVQDERLQSEVASYYGPNSGIDLSLRSFIEEGTAPRVAVVGLGAGMMSAYCHQLSALDYIEINPLVEVIAREYFTYLEQCPAHTTVAIGDGRLVLESMARKVSSLPYDIIMVDAFTDDAIPTHLLTREALLEAYRPLLSVDGIIAFHVTNRYLDLYPPIVGVAREQGYEAVVATHTPDQGNELHQASFWVLVTSPERALTLLEYPGIYQYEKRTFVWTDNKSSVFSVLSLQGSTLAQ